MTYVVKVRLEAGSLIRCKDLDHWISVPKSFSETLRLGMESDGRGHSQWVALRAEEYHSANTFEMALEVRVAELYVHVRVGAPGGVRKFYQLGNAHPQEVDLYTDPCCDSQIWRKRGYEKRLADACPGSWARKSADHLSLHEMANFLRDSLVHLNVTEFPRPPLRSSRRIPRNPRRN